MTTINPDSSVPPNNSSSPAASSSGQCQLRISDVLALPQDEEPEKKAFKTLHRRDLRSFLMGEDGFLEDRRRSSYYSSPPCRLVARWISWIRRVKIKGIPSKCYRRERGNSAGADMQPRCLTNGLNDVGCRNETCFNAWIGAYLLYLVAATRNELDRINAARVEMETILGNTKQLQPRRSVEGERDDGDDVFLEFSTRKSVVEEEKDYDDDDDCQPQFATNSNGLQVAASSSSTLASGSETPKREEFVEDMEQLEAELEAELGLLQLQLDGDKLMEHSQLQREGNGEETESSKTYSMISSKEEEEEEEEEEVIDPEHGQADAECLDGVSPYELERRLHEVLEARQQEEIRELEMALELMQLKLQEKELQVSWWKAVARGGRRLGISSSHEVQS